MRFIELKEQLKNFTVFSLSDIRIISPRFHRRRLNDWQNKGYIKKIIRGYYVFSDFEINENVLFEIANRIYSPSYVSLETALSYHGIIPEMVYGITSVSPKKTYGFTTYLGTFSYSSVKQSVFSGYELIKYANGRFFKIACPEKAILDYFYIHTDLKTTADFESIRFNKNVFLEKCREDNWYDLLEKFKQKRLNKRVKSFMEYMKNA